MPYGTIASLNAYQTIAAIWAAILIRVGSFQVNYMKSPRNMWTFHSVYLHVNCYPQSRSQEISDLCVDIGLFLLPFCRILLNIYDAFDSL